jgi:hypothetical protein
VAVADLNADGRPDIIISSGTSTLAVLLNTTAPGAPVATFRPPVTLQAAYTVSGFSMGDVNGDGRPDLVMSSNSNLIMVMLNQTGTGSSNASFAPPVAIPSADNPQVVVLGDLNDDGRLDVAYTTFGPDRVAVQLNTTPDGSTVPTFAAPIAFEVPELPSSLAIGDLDGDGVPDLAVVSNVVNDPSTGLLSVLVNTTAPGAPIPRFGNRVDYAVGPKQRKVLMVDVNGDQRKDLAVCSPDENTVSILLHN